MLNGATAEQTLSAKPCRISQLPESGRVFGSTIQVLEHVAS